MVRIAAPGRHSRGADAARLSGNVPPAARIAKSLVRGPRGVFFFEKKRKKQQQEQLVGGELNELRARARLDDARRRDGVALRARAMRRSCALQQQALIFFGNFAGAVVGVMCVKLGEN